MATSTLAELYELGEEIGQGAYAVVHRATRRADGASVAVKRLPKSDSHNTAATVQKEYGLLREATARLRHPHIVHLYEVFEDEHHYDLVMELCGGEQLFERLEREVYGEAEAAAVVRQLMEALRALHAMNVVHRDVKGDNCLFASRQPGAPIKLLDFGVAQWAHESDPYGKDGVVGTEGFSAPEVVRDLEYPPASDCWAAGVTLYVMLCGYVPFNNDSLIRQGKFEFDDEEWSEVSAEAKDFISKLFVVDPKKRMTAAEALRHEWLVQHCGPASEPPPSQPPSAGSGAHPEGAAVPGAASPEEPAGARAVEQADDPGGEGAEGDGSSRLVEEDVEGDAEGEAAPAPVVVGAPTSSPALAWQPHEAEPASPSKQPLLALPDRGPPAPLPAQACCGCAIM